MRKDFVDIADVVIIGGGLAGLVCALKMAPRKVTVITSSKLGKDSSSYWAQGGIAAALGSDDSAEKHINDTLITSCGLADRAIVQFMVKRAKHCVEGLQNYGVDFDRQPNGNYNLGREGAHSIDRIVRIRGDGAGREIIRVLEQRVRQAEHIKVLEGCLAKKLILKDNRLTGCIIIDLQDKLQQSYFLPAVAVVLATGGIGGLYDITTNPRSSVGSGLAMGFEAGAVVADCEFVQFHPTAMNVGIDPAPLATEALRGEGAKLVDSKGNAIVDHPLCNLAPRDVTARSVYYASQNGEKVYLDCSDIPYNYFIQHFTKVTDYCLEANIDLEKRLIPVAPAAHYHSGGILVDINGRSNVAGLWACGEVAATGVHGANRLASNSLLETLVFAEQVAKDISKLFPCAAFACSELISETSKKTSLISSDLEIDELRKMMMKNVGLVRTSNGLENFLKTYLPISISEVEFSKYNVMARVGVLVAWAALQRSISCGVHFRDDKDTSHAPLKGRLIFDKRTFKENISSSNLYA